jgi:predicted nucleic acid-binding protein
LGIDDFDWIIAGIALCKGISKVIKINADHYKRIKGIEVETH